MTKPRHLVPGHCYFRCSYLDSTLRIPVVDTLQFLEQIIDDQGDTVWLFREPAYESDPPSKDIQTDLVAYPEEQLSQVLSYRELASVFKELSHVFESQTLVEREIDASELIKAYPISARLSDALYGEDDFSLSFFVRYTDYGLLIERRAGNLFAQFFTHPLRNPAEDQGVLAMFAEINIRPEIDYFSDDRRTRVLAYQLQNSIDGIAEIVARTFVSVYKFTDEDEMVIE